MAFDPFRRCSLCHHRGTSHRACRVIDIAAFCIAWLRAGDAPLVADTASSSRADVRFPERAEMRNFIYVFIFAFSMGGTDGRRSIFARSISARYGWDDSEPQGLH